MAARSRNQPRPGLAWLIALAILLLILAATRAAAADPAFTRAYADAMSACDAACRDAADTEDDEDDGDEDTDDDDSESEDELDDVRSRSDLWMPPRRDHRSADDPADREEPDGDEPRVHGEVLDVDDPNLVETGLLAADDEPPNAEAIDTGAALASAAFVDAAELAAMEPRHRSRWGRIDLAISWRRNWDETAKQSTRGDTIWLVATWRR